MCKNMYNVIMKKIFNATQNGSDCVDYVTSDDSSTQ